MPLHLPFDRVPGGPQDQLPTEPPRPVQPVFVDVTGTRRRRIRRAGVLVAAASLSYLPMAASALLPGPSAPGRPGPLSAGGAPRETDDRPGTPPSPLDAPSPQDVPEPEDTEDPTRQPDVPEPGWATVPPTDAPATHPPAAAPSPSPSRLPVDQSPTAPPPRPAPPPWTAPPAQLPEIPIPLPTVSPTVTPSTTPDPTPGAAG